MLRTLNITKIYIDKIEKIEVEEAREVLKGEASSREIAIWTTDGNKYDYN